MNDKTISTNERTKLMSIDQSLAKQLSTQGAFLGLTSVTDRGSDIPLWVNNLLFVALKIILMIGSLLVKIYKKSKLVPFSQA